MLNNFYQHFKLLLVWGFIIGLIFGGASLFFPKQYSAKTSVLIISRDRTGIDPYTQAKSAERIGENLSRLMKTTDFYNKVISASSTYAAKLDKSVWAQLSEKELRTKWEKDVIGSMVSGGSLLEITVYADTTEQAYYFSNVVTETLIDRGWEYVGGDVAFKQVDSPLVSTLPARPNLIVNTAIGFWVGIVLSGLWISRYKKHATFKSR
jgi:capsular polysaccharide biosynthesis protein